jgi:tetratricopeptide (TPR) repeat protein
MSEKADKILRCASCGIAEGDEVKLKDCSACKLVKYCGIECQKKHRPEHKKACKRRAAELRDELLFKHPESSHLGDCPICYLPLPIDLQKSTTYDCCSTVICHGCVYTNAMRELEGRLEHKCPFCRHPPPTSDEENLRFIMKRVEANDPAAICHMGFYHSHEGDHSGAVKYYIKAATLGSMDAHYNLSVMYEKGLGVEKDEKKKLYHLECAVIGGHVLGRYNLGNFEERNGRLDRAIKHWIIAANLGDDKALEALKDYYRKGLVCKEDFAAALRAHQAAIEATKSPQRAVADTTFRKAFE